MVYILEDEKPILELIIYALKTQNIESRGFSHPKDFFNCITNELPKVILLDIMLPEMDGFTILDKLKSNQRTKKVPVILLTSLNSEFEKVKGLDLGADDYITKPFGIMELLARIRVILRRVDINSDGDFIFEGLKYSSKRHVVSINDVVVELTLKEFELLGLFVKSPDHTFSRDEILEIVWGCSYSYESRTIDMHIKSLRQKLGNWGKHIKTIRGVGYKLEKLIGS